MLYAKINKDEVWIKNTDGYANMMHMDGSKPTGFVESNYTTGVVHNMPNDPLRCFYYAHENLSFRSCTEYGYEYIYYPPEEDEEWDGGDDDGDYYGYACEGLEYDVWDYDYICTYDMWGNLV
jgi:hypothetical protein